MAASLGIGHRPHWWEVSALIPAPRLDFCRSLEFGYPPREETAGRVER